MKVTIEHSFCPYCDEVTELYFRIINTILFSTDETELRTGMERLFCLWLWETPPMGLPKTPQR